MPSIPFQWVINYQMQIDNMLVKNVLDIYIRVGMENMDKYENDFEKDLLTATAAFYKRKVVSAELADRMASIMLRTCWGLIAIMISLKERCGHGHYVASLTAVMQHQGAHVGASAMVGKPGSTNHLTKRLSQPMRRQRCGWRRTAARTTC